MNTNTLTDRQSRQAQGAKTWQARGRGNAMVQSINGVADRYVSAARPRRRPKKAAGFKWLRHCLQALRTVIRGGSSAMVMQARADRAVGACAAPSQAPNGAARPWHMNTDTLTNRQSRQAQAAKSGQGLGCS